MATETSTEIPRPESGDVVELILEDHRLFERLLRDLRNDQNDRAGLGSAWLEERNRMLEEGCGSITHLRAHLDAP